MSVPILVEFQRVSERAVLVHLNNAPMWLPKSQIENWDAAPGYLSQGDEITLVLSDWIARQKNITSNTTPDDTPINDEKFRVVAIMIEGRDGEGLAEHHVMAEGRVWCVCSDRQTAVMIAAALTLTEGKI